MKPWTSWWTTAVALAALLRPVAADASPVPADPADLPGGTLRGFALP